MSRHHLPNHLRGIWTQIERDYRSACADMQTAEVHGVHSAALLATHTAAVDAVLMTPAETVADIRLKIEVIRDHEVFDEWWCATEAVAMLAIDASRLLSSDRKGGAA